MNASQLLLKNGTILHAFFTIHDKINLSNNLIKRL